MMDQRVPDPNPDGPRPTASGASTEGPPVLAAGGTHSSKLQRVFGWLDRNIEKLVIVTAYSIMAFIVFEEVIRRFAFSSQASWSTTIPVYLFIWITWTGAAFNVRKRTHLSFTELRARMPYGVQFALRLLDSVLWIAFAAIVIFFALQQIQIMQMNFSLVPGTDNVMQWWFYLATPFGWLLILLRALQNMWNDLHLFRAREAFVFNVSIDAD